MGLKPVVGDDQIGFSPDEVLILKEKRKKTKRDAINLNNSSHNHTISNYNGLI